MVLVYRLFESYLGNLGLDTNIIGYHFPMFPVLFEFEIINLMSPSIIHYGIVLVFQI